MGEGKGSAWGDHTFSIVSLSWQEVIYSLTTECHTICKLLFSSCLFSSSFFFWERQSLSPSPLSLPLLAPPPSLSLPLPFPFPSPSSPPPFFLVLFSLSSLSPPPEVLATGAHYTVQAGLKLMPLLT